MNYSDLIKLLERADRFRKKLNANNGEGTTWPFTFENGETHFYSIDKIKPADEVEDELTSAFVWLWSLKDYVKKYAVSKGKSRDWVEVTVNADPYLCVCADIANSLKHGGLDRRSRSNKKLKLGSLKYNVPQEAMKEISIGAFDVNLNISNPSLVQLEMAVLSDDNKYIGDAFKYLDYSLKTWERIVSDAENNV